MNGDIADATYTILQMALSQNIQSVMDAGTDFSAVWDYDVKDACERICQIVMALGALHQMTVNA